MIPRQGLKTTDFSRKYREYEESKSDLVRNRSVQCLVSCLEYVIRYSLFNSICPQYMFLGQVLYEFVWFPKIMYFLDTKLHASWHDIRMTTHPRASHGWENLRYINLP